VVLFEMLTGQVPFDGESSDEVFEAATTQEPPDPSALRPETDAALAGICLRCLRKSPAARFPSATDLAAALAGWLAAK
jgi:serine/threonine protein kinase